MPACLKLNFYCAGGYFALGFVAVLHHDEENEIGIVIQAIELDARRAEADQSQRLVCRGR
jgi:hypothetical protein